jgi:hypothetical protein
MQSRWSVVLLSSYTLLLPCSLNSAASYDTKPIPSFIFQRTPIQSVCTEKEESNLALLRESLRRWDTGSL